MEEDATIDVSKESKVICPQLDKDVNIGQEDCLLLNVYVPGFVYNNPLSSEVPVMVYIHGGGLVSYRLFIFRTFSFYHPSGSNAAIICHNDELSSSLT
jgi:hypothetical protein